MNSQETETEITEFTRTQGRIGFEAAVIIFQDKIPESVRKEFNLHQWVAVWKKVLPETEIKKIAWNEISQAEASLADWISVTRDSVSPLKDLALDKIIELVSDPKQAAEYYWQVSSDEARKKKLLDKLSAMEASAEKWTAIFKGTIYGEIRGIAFTKMKETKESTFGQWAKVNEAAPDGSDYEKQSLEMMEKKAKSFDDWSKIRKKAPLYSSLGEKALKEMAKLAKGCTELSALYLSARHDPDLREGIADRISKSSGEFEEWFYLNQSVNKEDKLKQVSLEKMKKTADRCYHWDRVFHRAGSESDRKEAILKMIRLASDIKEAEHAYAHARDIGLGQKAIAKMKEIANKLAGKNN